MSLDLKNRLQFLQSKQEEISFAIIEAEGDELLQLNIDLDMIESELESISAELNQKQESK